MIPRLLGTSVLALVLMIGVSNQTRADIVAFDTVPGPYAGFAAINNGTLARNAPFFGLPGEDYIMDLSGTNAPGATIRELTSMQFVGGVALAPGTLGTFNQGVLDFTFFDAGGTAFSSFSATLGTAGNFIWTINLTPGFFIPTNGFLDVSIDASDPNNLDTAGNNLVAQWFIGSAEVTGTSPQDATNVAPGRDHSFQLTVVPEPATAGLVGLLLLGGCFTRRRRS